MNQNNAKMLHRSIELMVDVLIDELTQQVARSIEQANSPKPTASVEDENYMQGWIDGNNCERTERMQRLLKEGE
jgi:hypothetical protein